MHTRRGCTRAVLVGPQRVLRLNFLNAAVARAQVKRNRSILHELRYRDLGRRCLWANRLDARDACRGLEWDTASAHSAASDAGTHG